MNSLTQGIYSRNYVVSNWKHFSKRVRQTERPLLLKLNEFPNSILVSGCQRSGTTMLTRLIASSDDIARFSSVKDDELEGALILSGLKIDSQSERHCFQTTYLNECYEQYLSADDSFKLIWVIRNPYSTVYSLVHHWKRFALNELFQSCGVQMLTQKEEDVYLRFGHRFIKPILRACTSYSAKLSQLFYMHKKLGTDRLMVVDYDDLVNDHNRILPVLYDFLKLPYKQIYSESVSAKSLSKFEKLTEFEKMQISERCLPIYNEARRLL